MENDHATSTSDCTAATKTETPPSSPVPSPDQQIDTPSTSISELESGLEKVLLKIITVQQPEDQHPRQFIRLIRRKTN
jgi:hypothetical protein